MSAIGLAYDEQLTVQTDTTSGWKSSNCSLLDTTDIISGHKYLILYGCIGRNTSASFSIGIRLTHDGTAFAGCTAMCDPPSGAWGKSFFMFTVWTANGEDIIAQMSEAGTGVAELDEQVLIAIDLDDLDASDYKYDENTTLQALATAWSTSNNASVTFTPAQAEDWLILASGQTQVASASVDALSHMQRIQRSGEASDTTPDTQRELEDENNLLAETLARVFSLGASENTFTQQSAASSTPNTGDDRLRSAVFALRLAAFEDVTWQYTAGTIELDDTAHNTEIASVSHTPSVASQKAIIIAQAEFVPGGVNREMHGRVQVDNTTTLPGPTGASSGRYCSSFDVNDINAVANLCAIDLTAAAHDIDWDAYSTDTASGTFVKYRSLVVISPELAAGEALVKIRNEVVRA